MASSRTVLLKKMESMRNLLESRQSHDIDSNDVHIDTASAEDIEGCNGKDNNITGSENDLYMRISIIPLTQSAVGVPHVIDDGHADCVIDHNLNNFLDLVSDEIELPLESEFGIAFTCEYL